MKLKVKVSPSGTFSGGPSSTVAVEAPDYEMAQATFTALAILSACGIGEWPGGDEDEDSVGQTSEGIDATEAQYGEEPTGYSPAAAGDAVRIVFPDGSCRLFIDTGSSYYSPAVRGMFDTAMHLPYGQHDGQVTVAATLGASLGQHLNQNGGE